MSVRGNVRTPQILLDQQHSPQKSKDLASPIVNNEEEKKVILNENDEDGDHHSSKPSPA